MHGLVQFQSDEPGDVARVARVDRDRRFGHLVRFAVERDAIAPVVGIGDVDLLEVGLDVGVATLHRVTTVERVVR
ncbi:hypothetical protein [Georgenia sp. AZ-5]|uniref:hypothetical protein n=1 Tax=Georgenia sp. AZ-5 TaxID=3367526 RepID=UPI003755157B